MRIDQTRIVSTRQRAAATKTRGGSWPAGVPLLLAMIALGGATEATSRSRNDGEARLDAIAERIIDVYARGIPDDDHSRWPDAGAPAVAQLQAQISALLREVETLPASTLPTGRARARHATIAETLRADVALGVCRMELWQEVNHMNGWHRRAATVAADQPVGTAGDRAQALTRWTAFPAKVAQEIANARSGLAQGYSAPKSVVRKVIKQVEAQVAARGEASPFHSPAGRSDDAAFKATYAKVLAGPIHDALASYLAFLRDEYLPRARDSLAISAHPNGAACYRASLRSYTTIDRSPEDIFRTGKEAVARNVAFLQATGRRAFGTDDMTTITARVTAPIGNGFASEDDLVRFAKEVVERSRVGSIPLFVSLPAQRLEVEPVPPYQRGSGISPYYQPESDPAKAAVYRVNPEVWARESRAAAEIAAVHEGYPGHHVQVAYTTSLAKTSADRFGSSPAFIEGWARYAEMLAEEAGIYGSDHALMLRRVWPARGMVADPGLHLFGWSPDKVKAFIRESGRFKGEGADDLLDRMAVWPGQLTAYDTGGLEIMALREKAKRELGPRFDIKQFHQRVLENGIVPLVALRTHVTAWIAETKRRR